MKQFLVCLLALSCAIAFTSCASTAQPQEETFETLSGTIRLEASSEDIPDYPPENPAPDETPPLDDVSSSEPEEEAEQTGAPGLDEVRAVWFSYLEYQSMLTGRNGDQFAANIGDAFERVRDAGFNTVFVQVRPYGDALYPSEYFPWSHLITGEEGVDPGFDPLDIMIEAARSRSLRIEAWVNPYRIRSDGTVPLSSDNPARQWEDAASGSVIRYENGLYYNPASEETRKLIVNGVREIVEQYRIDGIHFDDYFYPTTDEAFDAQDFADYQAGGGTLTLGGWRRENVNLLVRDVYAAIKEIDPDVLFGISPQGNNENNYDIQFIDTAKWLAEDGYVDYICPQIYFGFENSKAPYQTTVKDWNRMIKNDSTQLYVGLAPYKIGLEDVWAGDGEQEWIENDDLLRRMVEYAREQEHYAGFAMFRYSFLFEPGSDVRAQVETELEHLQELF